MANNNELLSSFSSEYQKFKENASMRSSLADTKELISYLKNIQQQLKEGKNDNIVNESANGGDSSAGIKNYDKLIRVKVESWKDKVTTSQKQSNNSLSKLLRFVDNKVYDFDLIEELNQFNENILTGLKLTTKNKNLINQVILNHLVREGNSNELFSTGNHNKSFSTFPKGQKGVELKTALRSNDDQEENEEESQRLVRLLEEQFDYSVTSDFKDNLIELRTIIDSIIAADEPDLRPAFQWCKQHEEELQELNIDIEFNLHELQFYLLYYGINNPRGIVGNDSIEDEGYHYANDVRDSHKFSAYVYARNNFGKFVSGNERDERKFAIASKLLTSTIIDQGLANEYYKASRSKADNIAGSTAGKTFKNPYKKMILKNLSNYKTTLTQLVSSFFQINNLNLNSNLYLILMASYVALPYIIKFNSVNKKLKRSFSASVSSEKTARAYSEGSRGGDSTTYTMFQDFNNNNSNTNFNSTSGRSLSMTSHSRTAMDSLAIGDDNDNDNVNNKANGNSNSNVFGSKDELPIGIELPNILQNNHPIFICPISRQETTVNNPPVLLPCKHIISRESLHNLVESKQQAKRRRGATTYRNWLNNDVFEEEENEYGLDNGDVNGASNGDNGDDNIADSDDGDFSDDDGDSDISEDSDEDFNNNDTNNDNSNLNPGGSSERGAGVGSNGDSIVDGPVDTPSGYSSYRRLDDPSYLTGATGRSYWRVSSSMNRLHVLDSFSNTAFKCPYCPQICRKSQTREVFFGTC